MASTPNSSPSAVPPASNSPPPSPTLATSSPPPDPSPPPTSSSQPNATSDPPASPPPPNSSSSPPPSSNPPPLLPPISPPLLPAPPTPLPLPQPPPSPPPPPPAPLRDAPSPSPPVLSPPPPTADSPPPPVSQLPPASSPPPPKPISSPQTSPSPTVSRPPPANSPPPLPSTSPPPPLPDPPKTSPSTPPPSLPQPASPPPSNSPPTQSSPPANQPRPTPTSPSPPVPPSSLSPPPPQNNSSSNGSTLIPQPLPGQPSADPTNGATTPTSGVHEHANSTGPSGMQTGGAVAIAIVVSFIVLSLIGIALWFVRKHKKKMAGYNAGHVMPSPLGSSQMSDVSHSKTYSSAPLMGRGSGSDYLYSPPEPAQPGGLGNSRSWFTYAELVEATNGFSVQNLLGEGGFGCVYKGCLSDGREVAVKQLKIGGSQGEREFRAEVETISRVHHRHLVSLVGYCISEHQRLLVYDYVPNNTLHYHLHEEGGAVMDWAFRVKVAVGAARGIAYLHEDCHPRIIHRDIKSSNILLDNVFEAQVSDFGLAKLALDAYTHITTRVMGTFGYMAPEYASSGKLTEKSDVYSFGVVLLELITGRKPVDASQPLGDESLVEWARPLLIHALDNQEFEGLVDPKLGKNYVENEMFRMIEAAAACVRHSAVKRPRMGQVVRALECIGDSSDLSNGMRPGQSEIFDSAQQSAEIRMFRRMAFGSQDYSSDIFNSQNSWRS